MFTIEKGIPIPNSYRKGAPNKYPFSQMEVGDSFFVPYKDHDDYVRLTKTIHSAFVYYKKTLEHKHAMRKIVQENGIRVWRTE